MVKASDSRKGNVGSGLVTKGEVSALKSAQWYSVADFVRMTGMTRGQVRGMLVNAGLIRPAGQGGRKKQMVSADTLRRHCPRLFWALREQLAELSIYAPEGRPFPRPASHIPKQMEMFSWTVADLVDLTGLSRFQVRRRLMDAGLLSGAVKGKRIRVIRGDLREKCPALAAAIDARKAHLRAVEAIDAEFYDGDEENETWGEE